MGSLIKNELIKIFRRKSTYIVLIIFILFIVLTSFIYKFVDLNGTGEDYRFSDDYINYAREELKNIDINQDREHYIELKTDIDYYELYKKYEGNTWQVYIIERDFYGYLRNINIAKYGSEIEKEQLTINAEEEYNKALDKLNSNDWKKYVEDEMAETEAELSKAKEQKQFAENSSNSKELDVIITTLEAKLELSKLRLEKNIPYGNDYINKAIETKINLAGLDYSLDEPNMNYQDKLSKQETIQKYEEAKYIIDTQQDIDNLKTVRSGLLSAFEEYSMFIIIFVVMISGGIVSSELEKGTVKMLLVKPYQRWKILLAKYIASMAMIIFIAIATVVLEFIIGGIILGNFSSLSIPVVVYNFNTNSLQTYNVFAYILLIAVHKLPIYILLGTLAFAMSCIFGNTVISVVLPIIGNMASGVINLLLKMHPIKQLSIFPTLNWDFTEFMFGKLPSYEFTNFGFSSCVCIAYWLIMIVVAFIMFNKKEIKNV